MEAINTPFPLSGEVSYLLVSGLRVATAFAALLAVRAMIRYTRAAVPPPHAAANLLYWARYWWEVHWRESPALKVGGLMVASSLLSQVTLGQVDVLSQLTPYRLYVLAGMFLAFTGFAQFLNTLTHKIERK